MAGDASVWDRRRSLQGGLGMMQLSVERKHTESVTRLVTRPPSLLKKSGQVVYQVVRFVGFIRGFDH